MFDSKSYKLQIPEKSCRNCKHSSELKSILHQSVLLCAETDPVDQCGVCDNFADKKKPSIKKAATDD